MKTIQKFIFDDTPVAQAGGQKSFTISGDDGAVFSLQIKRGSLFYNFNAKEFVSNETKLTNAVVSNGTYDVDVLFPASATAHKFDIYLFAESNSDTKHAGYNEVRDYDLINVNKSSGSNSNILIKELYQMLNVNLSIRGYDTNNASGSGSPYVITTFAGAKTPSFAFSATWTSLASTLSISIKKQPSANDLLAVAQRTPLSPAFIEGENVYPLVTTPANLGAAASGTRVDSSSGQEITMYVVASTLASVGDRVTTSTTNHYLNDNVVTVTAVSTGSGKTFTISEEVDITDDLALNFSNSRNRAWLYSNVEGISPGMSTLTTAFPRQAFVEDYQAGAVDASQDKKAILLLGHKPVKTRDNTTLVETSVQKGVIVFSEQALYSHLGVNSKIFGFGTSHIKSITGLDLEFSNLALKLGANTTTTTSSPSANATFNVASGEGIGIGAIITGIGIDESVSAPTVTVKTNVDGSTYNGGSARITLSAVQTLETGTVLTFNTSRSVTISGNVKINSVAKENTIYFDMSRLIEAAL